MIDKFELLLQHNLKPGDIILTATEHWISTAIKIASWSKFSHAILYIGSGKAIEARGDGVNEKSLTDALTADGGDPASVATVFRYKGNLSKNQRQKIIGFARGKVKARAQYDYRGVSGVESGSCDVFNHNIQQNPEAYFCSELVAEAFRTAGVPLSDRSSPCISPKDLGAAPKTDLIGNLALMCYAP